MSQFYLEQAPKATLPQMAVGETVARPEADWFYRPHDTPLYCPLTPEDKEKIESAYQKLLKHSSLWSAAQARNIELELQSVGPYHQQFFMFNKLIIGYGDYAHKAVTYAAPLRPPGQHEWSYLYNAALLLRPEKEIRIPLLYLDTLMQKAYQEAYIIITTGLRLDNLVGLTRENDPELCKQMRETARAIYQELLAYMVDHRDLNPFEIRIDRTKYQNEAAKVILNSTDKKALPPTSLELANLPNVQPMKFSDLNSMLYTIEANGGGKKVISFGVLNPRNDFGKWTPAYVRLATLPPKPIVFDVDMEKFPGDMSAQERAEICNRSGKIISDQDLIFGFESTR